MEIQTLILRNLIQNEEYTRKTIPFLKKEYFDGEHREIFDTIVYFVSKYNKLPTSDVLKIEIKKELSEKIVGILNEIDVNEKADLKWLIDRTEKWCQDQAIYLAIMESISIIDGKNNELSKDSLPHLLSEALSVSFDNNIGHDYINDAESRFEFYHLEKDRIPFDIELLNKITKGGLPRKTLNVVLAGTGIGKSLFMCHHSSSCLMMGKNVLYITLEMAEQRIAERIDSNLMNVPLDQLESISKESFINKIDKIVQKGIGKLIIKEYPTGSAHVGHFRSLLNELKLKKNFIPDIIMIDYLNICASSRIKTMGNSINSYSYIKSIAEEIRGLAVEFNVPIISATQTTRSGFSNTDLEITDTSECIYINEKVILRDGTEKKMGDVKIGDQIISNDGYKTVQLVHHKKIKECYKIKLKSGKSIIVSGDHVFPTNRGRISINEGKLGKGDILNSR